MSAGLYTLLSFLPTVAGLLLISAIVASKNYRSRVNFSFIIWTFNILGYVALNFGAHYILTLSDGLLWTRAALAIANFIPMTFYYFSRALSHNKNKIKWYEYVIYAAPVIMTPLSFLPGCITEVSQSKYGIILSKTGPLLFLTLIYFTFAFTIAFRMLYKYQINATQSVKSQIKLISYSSSFVIVVNMFTQIIFPKLGMYSWGNIIGNPSILLFVGTVGYSILRHKLFDIRTAVLRTLVFATTFFASVIVFIVALLYPFHLIFREIKLGLWPEIYIVTVTFILAIGYQTFRTALQKATDKLLYQDHYDIEIVLAKIGRVLSSEILLDNLAQRIKKILEVNLRVAQVDIIVLNKDKIFYEAASYFTKIHDALSKDLLSLGQDILILDELTDEKQKEMLEKYGIEVFVPLLNRGSVNGFMIFTHKNNGTAYNLEDIKLIDNVRNELAVAVENSRSFSQIQQFNSSLQAKIEQATAELTKANEALQKQDSVKNDFISMISHQLGTPLAVMDGFLTLIVQGFYGKTNEKMQEALEKTLSRTRNMKGLVFDLLNISRMTAGKFFLEISDVDMAKVVSEEIEELQRQAHDRNVKLNYHAPEHTMPTIKVDEPKTRQAILNLINNAIYYSPNGTVDVYLDSDSTNIIFKVVDTGIGVPDEEKEHLFTKFFRADNARKESPNGTGIGLYLVKRVITDQHGKLIFTSQVGKGSVFGFTLPIKSEMPANAAMAVSINPPMNKTLDIDQGEGTMSEDIDEIKSTSANDNSDIGKDDVQPATAEIKPSEKQLKSQR